MKALSIRQPWAWLVAHGFKDIENREWSGTCHVRGEVLIHASQRCTAGDYGAAVLFMEALGLTVALPPLRDLECGGIVGTVRIVDAVRSHSSPWFNVPGFVPRLPEVLS